MQALKNISIPTPCHENWQNMDEVQQGRFCHSCAKTVVDFSAMTDQQVIDYLSNTQNVCGRIDAGKMDMINHKLRIEGLEPIGWLKKIGIAIAMLSLAPFAKLQAQTKPEQHQTDNTTSPSAIVLGKVLPAPSNQYVISGRITDKNGMPLPGSIITVQNNKNYKAVADTNGSFVLNVPDGEKLIDVNSIGYFSKSFTVGGNKNYIIKLEEEWMGELVMIKQPLPKRLLNKCIQVIKKKTSN